MSTSPLSRIQPSLFVALMIAGMLVNITGCAGPGMRLSMAKRSAERLGVENAAALEQINQRYQAGDLHGAYDAVKKHRRKHPYSWEARITEACIAADLGRTAESIQAWQAVVTAKPQSAKVLHEAGMHMVQLGAIAAGLPALQSAVERDPSNVNYRLDLSAAYLASRNSHAAQEVLMQAHRQLPQETAVPVAIARLFESQNVHNRAAHYYGVALKQSPDDPTLLRQRGRMWYQLGNYQLAQIDLAACETAMIAGEHWPALLEYGKVCLKMGDAQSARRVATTLGEKPSALTSEFQQFSVAVAAMPVPKPALVPQPEPFTPFEAPPVLLAATPVPTFVAQRPQRIQQTSGVIVVNHPPPAKLTTDTKSTSNTKSTTDTQSTTDIQPLVDLQPEEVPAAITPVDVSVPLLLPPPAVVIPVALSPITDPLFSASATEATLTKTTPIKKTPVPTTPIKAAPKAATPIVTGPILLPPDATPTASTPPVAEPLAAAATPAETGWRTTQKKSKPSKPARTTAPKTRTSAATKTNTWKPHVSEKRVQSYRKTGDARTLVKKKRATD
ncbi:tetratricopeptide repeat protein [Symmachiella dynata]|uniref:tetratricopeptide repeat protein n=1 Tax=Symmachiella dynata TaxID=2527995 RepID=UPI0030EBD8CF